MLLFCVNILNNDNLKFTLKIHLNIILFYIMLLLAGFNTMAQRPNSLHVEVQQDTTRHSIGEKISIKLIVQNLPNTKITWQQFDLDSGAIDLIEQSKIDTSETQLTKILIYMPFDSGLFNMPGYQFIVNGSLHQDTIITAPFSFFVHGIKTDTSKAFRPIQKPVEIPYTFNEYKVTILIALLAIILIIVAYYLYKKYFKNRTIGITAKPQNNLPADVLALNKLKSLGQKKLPEQGLIKNYYTELTDIVREYIESRYYIPALECTTDELKSRMQQKKINKLQRQKMIEMLTAADYVKFAKAIPMMHEHEMYLNDAVSFVESTKLITDVNPKTIQ